MRPAAAPGAASAPGLPAEWRLVLDPGLRRLESGRTLMGGYPVRILRLSPAGAAAVGRWAQGGTVGSSPAGARLARRLVDAGAVHPMPAPGSGRGIRWSLVVPTRGSSDGLATLLASALEPGFAPPASLPRPDQVILVDDGSPEPQAVASVAARYGALVVRLDRNQGPAAARNAGWRAARTEAVAFLDDDCRSPDGPGWVAGLLDHLADPAVAVVAPRVRPRRGSAPAWLARYEQAASSLDLGPNPAPIRRGSPVPYVPAAALLVRRSALEQIGGFDESLRVGEDVDLAWRLDDAGWSLRYEPGVVVAHDVRPGLAAWARQRFDYGTSAVALDSRRPRSVAPLRCSPWSAGALALSATTSPAGLGLGAAVAVGSALALARRLPALPSPARTAVQLTRQGHGWAARALVRAARREWWPLLALGLFTRRGRRFGLIVAAATASDVARNGGPTGIGRARFVALRVADDLAYGTGLWCAALRRGRFGALVPALSEKPANSSPPPTGEPVTQTTSST